MQSLGGKVTRVVKAIVILAIEDIEVKQSDDHGRAESCHRTVPAVHPLGH